MLISMIMSADHMIRLDIQQEHVLPVQDLMYMLCPAKIG